MKAKIRQSNQCSLVIKEAGDWIVGYWDQFVPANASGQRFFGISICSDLYGKSYADISLNIAHDFALETGLDHLSKYNIVKLDMHNGVYSLHVDRQVAFSADGKPWPSNLPNKQTFTLQRIAENLIELTAYNSSAILRKRPGP